MMGRLPGQQNALFYEFCLEKHIPTDHLLRHTVSNSGCLTVAEGILPRGFANHFCIARQGKPESRAIIVSYFTHPVKS